MDLFTRIVMTGLNMSFFSSDQTVTSFKSEVFLFSEMIWMRGQMFRTPYRVCRILLTSTTLGILPSLKFPPVLGILHISTTFV